MSKPYHRNPDQIISDSTKRCVAIHNFTRNNNNQTSIIRKIMNKFIEIKNNIAHFQIGSADRRGATAAYIANLAANDLEQAQQYELALTAFNKLERETLEAVSRVTEICRALNGKLAIRDDESEHITLPHGGAVVLTPLPEGIKQRYVEANGKHAVIDLGLPLAEVMEKVHGLLAESEWRILEKGEIIQEGDEYFNSSKWCPTESAGAVLNDYMKYRRRITQETEYRILEKGEIIQEGDEVQLHDGSYSLLARSTIGQRLYHGSVGRRKVTKDPFVVEGKCRKDAKHDLCCGAGEPSVVEEKYPARCIATYDTATGTAVIHDLTRAEIKSLIAHLQSLRS